LDAFIEENLNFSNILAVFGVVLAFYFYFKSKNNYQILYFCEDTTVVGSKSAKFGNDLKIYFGGVEVPRVTSTRFIMWNSGNVTIRPQNIANSDPISIINEDGVIILSSKVVSVVSMDTNLSFKWTGLNNSSPVLEFDFIRPGEGLVCDIVHSGEGGGVRLAGTICEAGGSMRPTKSILLPAMATSGRLRVAGYIGYLLVITLVAAAGAASFIDMALRFFAYKLDFMSEAEMGDLTSPLGYVGYVIFALVVLKFCHEMYRDWRRTPPTKLRGFIKA